MVCVIYLILYIQTKPFLPQDITFTMSKIIVIFREKIVIQPKEPSLFAAKKVEILNNISTGGHSDTCKTMTRDKILVNLKKVAMKTTVNHGKFSTTVVPPYLRGDTFQDP